MTLIMKVSILMSVYNESRAEIVESIESILGQSFSDFEFIIVNDNPYRKDLSTIIQNFSKKDDRIIFVENKVNIGLARSLNYAFSFARTDIIVRMDADDICMLNRIERQYQVLVTGNHDLVFSNYSIIDHESKPILGGLAYSQYFTSEEINTLLPYKNIIHHPTVMMKREIFELAGKYRDFPCAQDRDLWLRIWEKGGKFYMIDEVLLKYRIRPNSITTTRRMQQKITINYIERLFLERIINNEVDSYSIKNYRLFLEKNKIEDSKKKKRIDRYTKILSSAITLKKEGKIFLSNTYRLFVFIVSPVYRYGYINNFRIRLAIQRKKIQL